MSIGYSRKTRRQFLIGSGGAMLALPLLPSLLPEIAKAQTALTKNRMMNFLLNHHGESAYWPDRSIATTSVGTIGVKERLLSGMGTNASTVISSILSNSLYSSLLAKDQITMVRGLQNLLSDGNGHVTRTMGGHSVDEIGASSTNTNDRSTFDYIVEKSPTIYPSSPVGLTKSIRIDLSGGWLYVQRTGNVSVNPGAYGYYTSTGGSSIQQMYNSVFSSLTAGTVTASATTNKHKTNILNRVFPAFQSYRNNRKISSDDKARLDQHLGFISDLQSSYNSTASTLTCTQPAAPTVTPDQAMKINYLYADLLVIAFKCGLTQFASMQFEYDDPQWIPGYTGGPGYHAVMHGGSGLTAQHNAYESYQKFAYNLIADHFLSALGDIEGSTGRTYADNMITTALSPLGMQPATETGNHNDYDTQQLIFGSMGGKLRAGRYYALPANKITPAAPNYYDTDYLPHNTFIMTLLTLMGVPASEYSLNSPGGQGFGYYPATNTSTFGARVFSPITEMLT